MQLMYLILRLPVAERVQIHNWNIASNLPEGTLLAYGNAIEHLAAPMFPDVPALQELNARLFASHEAGAVGGAPERKLYRSSTHAGLFADPEGGGSLPVAQGPDGSLSVDVTAIEQAFQGLHDQSNWLYQQLTALQEATSKRKPAGDIDKLVEGLTKGFQNLRTSVNRTRTTVLPSRSRSAYQKPAAHRPATRTQSARPRGGEPDTAAPQSKN
jgi:hypothetical protein